MRAEGRSPNSEVERLAFVALGANAGETQGTILRAIQRLEELTDRPLLKSSLWETAPVDCPPDSPVFINAVVGFPPRAGETPESLLGKLQSLETEFGRRRTGTVNEPRPLDLDLIAFGSETRSTAELVLPHPRAHLRRFVLQPLSEIAPDLQLPGQRQTVAELLGQAPPDPNMRKLL